MLFKFVCAFFAAKNYPKNDCIGNVENDFDPLRYPIYNIWQLKHFLQNIIRKLQNPRPCRYHCPKRTKIPYTKCISHTVYLAHVNRKGKVKQKEKLEPRKIILIVKYLEKMKPEHEGEIIIENEIPMHEVCIPHGIHRT